MASWICRGDTIRAWAFGLNLPTGLPADFEFSAHLESLDREPVFTASTDGPAPKIQQIQVSPTRRVVVIPAWNVTVAGQVVWDLDLRLPTVVTANGVWTLTLCKGGFTSIQDGAGRAR